MDITEVRIKLTEDSDDRLQAFCSVTFDDCFVVRDLKIIEGANGPFVAMPSRKLTSHCPRCGCKNHLRAAYCNQCGGKLNPDRALRDQEGRAKLYADISHPINSECREMIQDRVIAEYERELDLSKQPGYVPRFEDEFEDNGVTAEPAAEAGELATSQDSPRSVDQPQIEPAASEPRAPHKPHSTDLENVPKPQTRRDRASRDENFGAGIFEE